MADNKRLPFVNLLCTCAGWRCCCCGGVNTSICYLWLSHSARKWLPLGHLDCSWICHYGLGLQCCAYLWRTYQPICLVCFLNLEEPPVDPILFCTFLLSGLIQLLELCLLFGDHLPAPDLLRIWAATSSLWDTCRVRIWGGGMMGTFLPCLDCTHDGCDCPLYRKNPCSNYHRLEHHACWFVVDPYHVLVASTQLEALVLTWFPWSSWLVKILVSEDGGSFTLLIFLMLHFAARVCKYVFGRSWKKRSREPM